MRAATRFENDVYENKLVGARNGVELYRRTEGPQPGCTLKVDSKVKKFVRATRAWKLELKQITAEAEALAGGPLAQPQILRVRIAGNALKPETAEQTRLYGGFHAHMHPTEMAFAEDLGQRRRQGPLGADAEQLA
jgi:hypothetical protein